MGIFLESRKNKRKNNQDNYCYMEYRINLEAALKVYLVADGMGGLEKGEQFSKMAIGLWQHKLLEFLMGDKFSGCSLKAQIDGLCAFSYRVIQEINEEVYQYGLDNGIYGGTTLTTAILFWDQLIVANCGDSPAFLLTGDKLKRLTMEHNVAEQLIRTHKIERGSETYYQKKNLLTDFIGKYAPVEPHVIRLPYREEDLLLMGSDGAFGELLESELLELLLENEDSDIISAVFDYAVQKGENDNQTMILYRGKNETKEAYIEKIEEEKQIEEKKERTKKSSFFRRLF